jgi:hypothetical protein
MGRIIGQKSVMFWLITKIPISSSTKQGAES